MFAHVLLHAVDALMANFEKIWALIESDKASVFTEKHSGYQYKVLTGKLASRVSV